MRLKMLNKQEVPLLGRKRINYMVEFDLGTPSKKEILENLAKILKVDKELIAIRHIYQRFGDTKAKVIVHVYKNKEDLKKLEKKIKEKPEEKPKEIIKEEKKEPVKESKEEKVEDGKKTNKEQKSK